MELIILYHERWEEELVFDEQRPTRTRGGPTKPAGTRRRRPPG